MRAPQSGGSAADAVSADTVRSLVPASPRGLSPGQLASKVFNKLRDSANAVRWLRGCTSVGAGSRVKGRVRVENRGSITIGRRFNLSGRWIPCELASGAAGRIQIGHEVWVNYGTLISASSSVVIGDRVSIGQLCILQDSDFPGMDAPDAAPRGITIGDDVWMAARVTVCPGVTIGAGSVIIAGSVVESDIPPGVIAGGIPARVLSRVSQGAEVAAPASFADPQQPKYAQRIDQGQGSGGLAPGGASTESTVPAPKAAPVPALHGHLISDFTIDDLANELLAEDTHPPVGATVAPFDQVTQTLLSPPPAGTGDFAVIWTRPERAVPAFARLLAYEGTDPAAWQGEVDAFCAQVTHAAAGYRFVFVPTWTLPSWERGLGMLDGRRGGAAATLAAMNLRLMERLEQTPNVYVLNAARWLQAVGPGAMNPKAWYLGKMAVSRPVMTEAARDIRAALGALAGGPRKLIVLDLDNTLWGGVVGDVGWEDLRLGGMDASGEAFVDFRKALKDLKSRGIVLALASKNEESVALEAIRKHPSMVLRESDFVGWRINWDDKAGNILDLTRQLNLGLQSVVFIDDNPVERARVREALPEVYVPEWPVDEFHYLGALRALSCFDSPALSREDLERTRMYGEESQREALKQSVGSVDEWLASLAIRVSVEPVGAETVARAAQLLNKTNQLNLSTRRLTEPELLQWAQGPGRRFYVIGVADRFGEAGLTGLLGIEFRGDAAHIVDFVLSCRVMGRKVEETMVHIAVEAATRYGASCVVAQYLPTAKNKPCLGFWQRSGFESEGQDTFVWKVGGSYALPAAISLDWQE